MKFRPPHHPLRDARNKAVGVLLLLPALNVVGVLLMYVLRTQSHLINLFAWIAIDLLLLRLLVALTRRWWERRH
ncbi:hypothetical protein AB0J55_44880 [Amycolatopsis sp. NPDC049688]|uniref:hypothetical protein n=1 Tax=Amycolatopsis sp. NPDC049688 TaxID=3154733 RepID=UPI00343FE902